MLDTQIDNETFNISMRKGASLLNALSLVTEQDMTDCCYDFVVLGNYGQAPIVHKTCKVVKDNLIILDLDSNESEILSSDGENYKTYYWGLILYNEEGYRNTIVPRNFEEKPEFRVYPSFEICT